MQRLMPLGNLPAPTPRDQGATPGPVKRSSGRIAHFLARPHWPKRQDFRATGSAEQFVAFTREGKRSWGRRHEPHAAEKQEQEGDEDELV